MVPLDAFGFQPPVVRARPDGPYPLTRLRGAINRAANGGGAVEDVLCHEIFAQQVPEETVEVWQQGDVRLVGVGAGQGGEGLGKEFLGVDCCQGWEGVIADGREQLGTEPGHGRGGGGSDLGG